MATQNMLLEALRLHVHHKPKTTQTQRLFTSTKQSSQTSALSLTARRLCELAQTTNFTVLKSAELLAWHKTTLTTLAANQPAAFVLEISVVAAVVLHRGHYVYEKHLSSNATTHDPITDNQQLRPRQSNQKALVPIRLRLGLSLWGVNTVSSVSEPGPHHHHHQGNSSRTTEHLQGWAWDLAPWHVV